MGSSVVSLGVSSFLSSITRKFITEDDGMKSQSIPRIRFSIKYKYVFLYCIILGMCYIILGIQLYFQNKNLISYEIDYSKCKKLGTNDQYCYEAVINPIPNSKPCICELILNIKKESKIQTNLIYRLDKFYQGYAYYSTSFDPKQLSGGELPTKPSKSCQYGLPKELKSQPINKIYPCGLLANSIFNDTFELIDHTNTIVELIQDDIVPYHYALKFKPTLTPKNKTVKPHNWPLSLFDIGKPPNQGVKDWHFMAWMMVQPFEVNSKIYAKIKPKNNKTNYGALKPNNYTIRIHYNYPILWKKKFLYSKKLIITNVNVFGTLSIHFWRFFIVVGPLLVTAGIIGYVYDVVLKRHAQLNFVHNYSINVSSF